MHVHCSPPSPSRAGAGPIDGDMCLTPLLGAPNLRKLGGRSLGTIAIRLSSCGYLANMSWSGQLPKLDCMLSSLALDHVKVFRTCLQAHVRLMVGAALFLCHLAQVCGRQWVSKRRASDLPLGLRRGFGASQHRVWLPVSIASHVGCVCLAPCRGSVGPCLLAPPLGSCLVWHNATYAPWLSGAWLAARVGASVFVAADGCGGSRLGRPALMG